MLLQGESMPAAHALEAGANRCGEEAGQSLRRKARPRRLQRRRAGRVPP